MEEEILYGIVATIVSIDGDAKLEITKKINHFNGKFYPLSPYIACLICRINFKKFEDLIKHFEKHLKEIKKCKVCEMPITKNLDFLSRGIALEEYKDNMCYDCYLLEIQRGGENE